MLQVNGFPLNTHLTNNTQGVLITMAITRVWIEEGCISCGLSEDNCPEVFKIKDEGSTVKERVNYLPL